MTQKHNIILWRNPDNELQSFENISRNAFKTMGIFQQFNTNWQPNYLTGHRKNTEKFNWSYENFSETLKKCVNKEGKKIFLDLGYSISFFSALNEYESFGYLLNVGSTKFINNLIIDIPINIDLSNLEIANTTIRLFEKLVENFKPFWGCIANESIASEYGYFDIQKKLPKTIFWLNYFDNVIIENMDKNKIIEIVNKNEEITFNKGIFQIKNTAIDIEKEDDMLLYTRLNKYFNLN